METYDKLTTDVVGGLFGTPVTAYYFGENRKCRIEVSMEQSAPTATASENDAASGGGSDSEEGGSPATGGEPDQDDNEGVSVPPSDGTNQSVRAENLLWLSAMLGMACMFV